MKLAILSLALIACSSSSAKDEPSSTPPVHPHEAALLAGTWTGTLDSIPMQLAFSRSGTALVGVATYSQFGRARQTDKLAVAIGPDGAIHLKGAAENPIVGNPKLKLDELLGTLSADRTTLAGTLADKTAWTLSTKASLAAIDPPLDLAQGEAALLGGRWEGTLGSKPATLVVKRQAGKLVGRLTQGRSASTFQLVLDAGGGIALGSQPVPTPRGLVTLTGTGVFTARDLARLSGQLEQTTKQGAIEEASSVRFAFENLAKARRAEQR